MEPPRVSLVLRRESHERQCIRLCWSRSGQCISRPSRRMELVELHKRTGPKGSGCVSQMILSRTFMTHSDNMSSSIGVSS